MIRALFVLLCAMFLSSCDNDSRVLLVCGWSDFIPQKLLDDFTQETGVKVMYEPCESVELIEAKLVSNPGVYDLVIAGAWPGLDRAVNAELYDKIDWDVVRYDVFDPGIMTFLQKVDSDNEYFVPYLWGTTGWGYRSDMIAEYYPDAPIDSLAIIFDPDVLKKLRDCGANVTLLDSPSEVFPALLIYLGYSVNDRNLEHLREAADHLRRIYPLISSFDSSLIINDLVSGSNICSQGWSSSINMARMLNKNVKYVSSGIVWIDGFAVPRMAPHRKEAYMFIEFISRAENAALATNSTGCANAVIGSEKFLTDEVRAYANSAFPVSAEIEDTPPAYYHKERMRLWQKIKAGI